ncbi:Protein of unknown function [Pyronema omphalodes CBS 100304]|uniref:Uncharacterized protein n=1 Tax=Pyronema omphalodes (strain CBS 100304) TaxID=1076935 RepID=U4LQ69_PYROM|nr:Protein of unknown function [Pyronema omphalodes CBS 100304]
MQVSKPAAPTTAGSRISIPIEVNSTRPISEAMGLGHRPTSSTTLAPAHTPTPRPTTSQLLTTRTLYEQGYNIYQISDILRIPRDMVSTVIWEYKRGLECDITAKHERWRQEWCRRYDIRGS